MDASRASSTDRASPAHPDLRFGATVCIAFAALLLPRIIVHAPWRDEMQAWMLAAGDTPTLATLAHRVAYEGHPYAWFLLLWMVGRAWCNPLAMKLLHAAIASGNVFAVAAFAPMSRATRVLLCLGYFFSFEYAVVSRDYGLGVLPLLCFAATLTWRPGALRTQATWLALAAQMNAYSAMLAGVLALWLGLRRLRGEKFDGRGFAIAAFIVATGMLAFILQMIGAPDRFYPTALFGPSWIKLRMTLVGAWYSLVPLPAIRRDWWNRNAIEQLYRFVDLNWLVPALGFAIILAAFWLLPPRRHVRALWAIGAVALLGFGTTNLPGWIRHGGHLYVLFVLAWWLGQDPVNSDRRVPADARTTLVRFGILVHAVAGVMASAADAVLPFSASTAAARFISDRYPTALVLANIDFETSPVAGLIGRPIYYVDHDRFGSYVIWDRSPRVDVTATTYTQDAARLNAATPSRPVVLLLSDSGFPGPDPKVFRWVASFRDTSIVTEQYALYERLPAPPATRP